MPFDTPEERIIDWIVAEFRNDQGIDLSKDPMAMQRIREAATKAKSELDSKASAAIHLPFITADARGPKHLQLSLTREKFDHLGR